MTPPKWHKCSLIQPVIFADMTCIADMIRIWIDQMLGVTELWAAGSHWEPRPHLPESKMNSSKCHPSLVGGWGRWETLVIGDHHPISKVETSKRFKREWKLTRSLLIIYPLYQHFANPHVLMVKSPCPCFLIINSCKFIEIVFFRWNCRSEKPITCWPDASLANHSKLPNTHLRASRVIQDTLR